MPQGGQPGQMPQGQLPGAPSGQSSTGMSMLPNVQASGMPPVKTPEVPGINSLSPAQKVMM